MCALQCVSPLSSTDQICSCMDYTYTDKIKDVQCIVIISSICEEQEFENKPYLRRQSLRGHTACRAQLCAQTYMYSCHWTQRRHIRFHSVEWDSVGIYEGTNDAETQFFMPKAKIADEDSLERNQMYDYAVDTFMHTITYRELDPCQKPYRK